MILLLYVLAGNATALLLFQEKNKHIEKRWYVVAMTILLWPPALLPLLMDVRNE